MSRIQIMVTSSENIYNIENLFVCVSVCVCVCVCLYRGKGLSIDIGQSSLHAHIKIQCFRSYFIKLPIGLYQLIIQNIIIITTYSQFTGTWYMNLTFPSVRSRTILLVKLSTLTTFLTVYIQVSLGLPLPLEISTTSKQSILLTIASMSLLCT